MAVQVMKTIDEHIQKDQEEFLKALSEHNEGKVRHLADIGLLAKTTHFDQSVDLPLWSKAHNRSSQEPITSCDIKVAN